MAASGHINTVSSRRSRSRETTNRRIEHLVIGIICTYTICWLPYWITQLCVSFNSDGTSPMDGFYECFLIATCLSYTNSALNPILYAFLSDNFKRRCFDVLNSNYAPKCFQQKPKEAVSVSQAPPTTTICPENQSEPSRPESRQTVVLNESVRLIPSPIQFNTASKAPERKEENKVLRVDNIDSNMVIGDTQHHQIFERRPTTKKNSVAFSIDTIVVQAVSPSNIANNHSATRNCPDL